MFFAMEEVTNGIQTLNRLTCYNDAGTKLDHWDIWDDELKSLQEVVNIYCEAFNP